MNYNLMKILALMILSVFYNISCSNRGPKYDISRIKSDSEMIIHLKENNIDFDSLRIWIVNDELEFMWPSNSDTRHLNKISQERTDSYSALMKKISIESIARGNKYRHNSIIFYLPVTKIGEKEINKGYLYKIDPNIENKDWIETDGDVQAEAEKHEPNTFVYKPIDKHWSLVCLIQ